MSLRVIFSCLVLTVSTVPAAPALAATLHAADGSSTLYTLDDTTGAVVTATASNYFLDQLALAPDGTLYGLGSPTAGGVQRIVTIDVSTATATPVTTSVAALGSGSRWQGIVDMTFDTAGNLFLAHHRHGGFGSGVGVYAASLVDGSAGAFVTSATGGFGIGTLDNANLLQWGYENQLETTFAGVGQPALPTLGNAAGQSCSLPSAGGGGSGGVAWRPMAVEPGAGVAWAFDSSGCGLVQVSLATGLATGVGDPSGLGFLTGLAVASGLGCPTSPSTQCSENAKSITLLLDKEFPDTPHPATGGKGKLVFKWVKGSNAAGGAVVQSDFGPATAGDDPTPAGDVHLCLYENGGLLTELTAPRTGPWSEIPRKGWKYVKGAGFGNDGVEKVVLKANDAGKAAIVMIALGANVPVPQLPRDLDPTGYRKGEPLDHTYDVQLHIDGAAACHGMSYDNGAGTPEVHVDKRKGNGDAVGVWKIKRTVP